MTNFLHSGKQNKKRTDFFRSSDKNVGKTLIVGAVAGFLSTVGFIALFAVAMMLINIDRMYAPLFATLSVSGGAFISALYVAKRLNARGIISGLLTGLVYFVLITAVSLAVDSSGIGLNTLFHFIIILLSASIGGILGNNKKDGKIKL